MASTSTNKQPLFIDRVLHYVVNLDTATNDGLDIVGTNTAKLIVDAVSSDGAIIEDIYAIARSTSPYTVNLYISTARDYLRPNESAFVGKLISPTTAGERVEWTGMPKSLAPVPQVGSEPANKAFYLPKGYALWAAREGSTNVSDGPLRGCQGGWY